MGRAVHSLEPGMNREKADRLPGLRTQFALDSNGSIVYILATKPGEKYYCPNEECGSRLKVRHGRKLLMSGNKMRPHYSHLPSPKDTSPSPRKCDPDRLTHWEAQQQVVKTINDWKSGEGDAPIIVWSCLRCRSRFEWRLPDVIASAATEYFIKIDGSPYRIDVAMLRNDEVKYAVEVYKSHYVEDKKCADLNKAGYIYFEVDAVQVLREPHFWNMINSQVGFDLCPRCKEWVADQEKKRVIEEENARRRVEEQARQLSLEEDHGRKRLEEEATTNEPEKAIVATSTNIQSRSSETSGQTQGKGLWGRVNQTRPVAQELYARYWRAASDIVQEFDGWVPKGFYRYMIMSCFRCNRDILVYTWPGKVKWDPRKPYSYGNPKPRTIQEVVNPATYKSYWGNVCPHCETTQGDQYLKFPVEPQSDSDQAFHADMMRIAMHLLGAHDFI